jgi:aspartate ammonia-lyase
MKMSTMAHKRSVRLEHDFLGERELPNDVYYGVQTLRAKENFNITGIPISTEPLFIKAFGYVKKAAAKANCELGVLDEKVNDAISKACDQLIAGNHLDQFVSDLIQGGAGTSCNMNANEVIANIGLNSWDMKKETMTIFIPTIMLIVLNQQMMHIPLHSVLQYI